MNNIAIFGYGTVGKGVYELTKNNPLFKVAAIFDKPEKKEELHNLLVTDIDSIILDKSIDTVVECLGGDSLPHEVIIKALKNKKNVVSSNKETISKHLSEYLRLANDNKVSIQFEASVGGGIPLIYPLTIQSDFDEIFEVKGILNGTSNFILTKMSDEKMDKNEAIKLAQEKGFAEKDPTADLEGIDMVRKGCILASLITKKEIHNEDILHFGISNLNASMIAEVAYRGKVLKLITDIKVSDKGTSVIVLPVAIDKNSPLAQVKNEYNGVLILGKYQEPLTFIGKGAGKNPTASAIVSDLVRINKKIAYPYPDLKPYYPLTSDLKGKYLLFSKESLKEVNDPTEQELKAAMFIARVE